MGADDLRHVIASACVVLIASKERAFAAFKNVNIMYNKAACHSIFLTSATQHETQSLQIAVESPLLHRTARQQANRDSFRHSPEA
jgi:hypothetical protein